MMRESFAKNLIENFKLCRFAHRYGKKHIKQTIKLKIIAKENCAFLIDQ